MRLVHLSDLHLGKKLSEASLMEDQRHMLTQVLCIIDQQKPDCVLIAGDVYDKPVPPAEAVALLDDFLTNLAARALPVVLISMMRPGRGGSAAGQSQTAASTSPGESSLQATIDTTATHAPAAKPANH